eukprot:Hpha_TRINITY_DN14054_c0_g1::TRINITY_DN14054_c0_g1_i1::g.44367::m.44367
MPVGGCLRFSEQEIPERKEGNRQLKQAHVLKFRARLDSKAPLDLHREFTGGYFPRFRSLYVSEVKERAGRITLHTMMPEAVHKRELPGGKEDFYYTKDFVAGAKIVADDGTVFVVTDVDLSRLLYETEPEAPRPPKDYGSPILQKIREKIRGRAGAGEEDGRVTVRRLGKHFRIVDDSGDRKLDSAEFGKALREYGLDLSEGEVEAVQAEFDADDDGFISYDEFMEAVRGPMAEIRKLCVQQAFKKIDYNKDGVLTASDFKQFYNAKYHPKVLQGEMTEDEAIMKFASRFEGSKQKNGTITWDEFQDYYNGVSASIDDDEHFVFMMERAWNLDNRNATKTPFR